MSNAAEAFAAALEAERQAALRADFETLLRVQDEKRELLPALREHEDQALVAQLSERARKNLVLLRQLLATVQGALGVANESAYTASGHSSMQPGAQTAMSAITTVRGRI